MPRCDAAKKFFTPAPPPTGLEDEADRGPKSPPSSLHVVTARTFIAWPALRRRRAGLDPAERHTRASWPPPPRGTPCPRGPWAGSSRPPAPVWPVAVAHFQMVDNIKRRTNALPRLVNITRGSRLGGHGGAPLAPSLARLFRSRL